MTRRGKALTISASPETRERLEKLALKWGYKWGESANMSAFVEAIANGEIQLGSPSAPPNGGFNRQERAALKTSIKLLADIGDFDSVIALANLLGQ